jgi:hypothetical protein
MPLMPSTKSATNLSLKRTLPPNFEFLRNLRCVFRNKKDFKLSASFIINSQREEQHYAKPDFFSPHLGVVPPAEGEAFFERSKSTPRTFVMFSPLWRSVGWKREA